MLQLCAHLHVLTRRERAEHLTGEDRERAAPLAQLVHEKTAGRNGEMSIFKNKPPLRAEAARRSRSS